jgi:hypothetical protein
LDLVDREVSHNVRVAVMSSGLHYGRRKASSYWPEIDKGVKNRLLKPVAGMYTYFVVVLVRFNCTVI